MKTSKLHPSFTCDLCNFEEYRYDDETMKDTEYRIFRWGWLKIGRFHFCWGCVYTLLFSYKLNLATYPRRDELLDKFTKNIDVYMGR